MWNKIFLPGSVILGVESTIFGLVLAGVLDR